jgi:peptide-methionine (R)-S-oxide reductase
MKRAYRYTAVILVYGWLIPSAFIAYAQVPGKKATSASATEKPHCIPLPAVTFNNTNMEKIRKSETEWQEALTPKEYEVLRQKGTERAFTGEYWNAKDDGIYTCRACGAPLFDSRTKFDSGTGWPSFFKPLEPKAVGEQIDRSHGMVRTEVYCNKCESHLGHVFEDGPAPTGLRYCLNSTSIRLSPRSEVTTGSEAR